jgi:3-oxoacyl-[acyl-carrier protein] reductase
MQSVAVVSGAARGIGRAIAEKLHAAGYRVVMADVSEGVHEAAKSLADPDHVLSQVVDVRHPEQVKSLMARTVERFGRLDALVNVAGTCHRESFAETTLEIWNIDVETNLTGTFLMCQAAVFPYMKEQRYGRILNIASVSGKTGGIGPVHDDGSGGRSGIAYAAAKAGVINMTKWIARDVGKWGITCNAIAPGPIETEMTKGHTYHLDEMPIPRWGTPQDVAEAAEFLLRKSSSFITGVCLNVDGGLVMA